jgi:membrane carboxypeptidase/penicillin-binding protein PbpC
VKTGTTNDFRDNWTIGYSPNMVAGVWVGNADYTPMVNVSGISGAAPIWHNFMERAHEGLPIQDFVRPPTIVELEVCADSGTLPSPVCPERRREIFFQEQPPLGPENDIHQLIMIDRNTGLRANEFCRANVEERYYRVYPPDAREWALRQGIEQPPEGFCPSTNIVAGISSPLEGSTVRGLINLEGSATAANFAGYQIELGQGTEPQAFVVIQERINRVVEQGPLGSFDTTLIENGPYTLRLVVFDQSGGASENRVRVLVDNPVVTATYTPEARPSPTETRVIPTETPVIPTETPVVIPSDTPTVISQPTEVINTPEPTPSPTTEIPDLPPTETPVPVPTSEVPSRPTSNAPIPVPTEDSLEAGR